jgi:uncharacterized cupredoxin-like copper-binding protein
MLGTSEHSRGCQTEGVRLRLSDQLVRPINLVRLLSVSIVLGTMVAGGGSITAAAAARPVLAAKTETPKIVIINMGPVKYNPAVISVPAGKPVILRFVNKATIDHEAFIGDSKAQDDHEKMMQSMPGMDMHTGVKGFVDVKPGESKDLSWTFLKAGITFIGCHKPAHYKGGMKLRVVVKSSTGIA